MTFYSGENIMRDGPDCRTALRSTSACIVAALVATEVGWWNVTGTTIRYCLANRGKGVSPACRIGFPTDFFRQFRHHLPRVTAREALGVNDEARAVKLLKGVVGKRLTYQTVGSENARKEA